MKEITVVIPNYNGKKYLLDCLSALEKQEPGTLSFDTFVVDNGSTDGSTEFLEKYCKEEHKSGMDVRSILLTENTGFCHAVNEGIQAATTPYVILLNNDTKVKPGFVKYLYEAISKDGRIFSVSAKMLMWDKPELVDDAGDRYCVLGWAYSRGKGKKAAAYDGATDVFSACGGAAIYRRSVFDEIGLFDELHFAYLEDLDIGYRARIYGYRNCYEPRAEVLHYGSASSGSRYNEWKTKLASSNSVYLIGKNMPFVQRLINFPFFLTGFALKFLFFCKKKMGILYLQGLWNGLRKCFSEQGRSHKIPFRWKYFGNYIRIQGQLYVNLFRFLVKS